MNIETLRFALAEYERMLASIPAVNNNTHERFARRVYERLIEDTRLRLTHLNAVESNSHWPGNVKFPS